jgi:hypothetical protein
MLISVPTHTVLTISTGPQLGGSIEPPSLAVEVHQRAALELVYLLQ